MPGNVAYAANDRERELRRIERIAKEIREGGSEADSRIREEYGTSAPPQRQTSAPPPPPGQPGGLGVDLSQLGPPTGEVAEDAAPTPAGQGRDRMSTEEEFSAPAPPPVDPLSLPATHDFDEDPEFVSPGIVGPGSTDEEATAGNVPFEPEYPQGEALDPAQESVPIETPPPGQTDVPERLDPLFSEQPIEDSGAESLPDSGEAAEEDTGQSFEDTGFAESEAGDTGLGVSEPGDTGRSGGLAGLATALAGDTDGGEDTDEGERDTGEETAAPAGEAQEEREFGPGQPGYMPDPPPLSPTPIGGEPHQTPSEPPVEQGASVGQPKRVSQPPGMTAFEAQAHNITPASPSAMAASVPSLSMASGAQGQTDSPRARYNKRKTQALTNSLQQRLQREQEQTPTTVA